jgi:glycosyltransferase involved in cell wall biosynthesis
MKILFVNGQSFLPQMVGGVETSTLDLCLTLRAQGHDPALLCGLSHGGGLWLRNRIASKLLKQHAPRDMYQGLRVYRSWSLLKGLDEVAQREQPDVIVVQGALFNSYEAAAASLRLGYPTVYYVHDASVLSGTAQLPDLDGASWMVNSNFTAAILQKRLAVASTIVPPLIRPETYRVPTSRRTVTMINPRPIKGGDIAVALAEACPDIPFQFIEAWEGDNPEVAALRDRAARLPNTTWLPSQKDMRKVYGTTRVLLAPSRCAETWGRVVTEAQFMGIPALASRIGALPETVGPGGIVVDPDADIPAWTAALRALWDDAATYERYSQAAADYSQRAEIAAQPLAAHFASALQRAIDTARAA